MQTDENILSQLNTAQQQAVTYCDSPQLVIAGAGSGKTRVLTFKIAYLLNHYDLKPWSILALTFTNKAAREMKERIASIVGEERARYLQMGTFHSVFSHILRVEAQAIGYNSDFTIYDETDSRSLIKNILKQMGLDDKTYKPATVHAAISMAKNHLCGPAQYAADGDNLQRDMRRNMPETHKIFMAYQQRLRQANAMDFDDLLTETYRLLKENEEIRQKYANRFQYVLVDEYQDTNYAQQMIVELLTKDNPHVCVVGDDYQSIYAFRGANISNILKFNKVYPTAKLFKLERNYRSTKNIVSAANSLMKHNRSQIDKDVYSENADGDKVTVYETISDKREASIVCREIKRLIKEEHLKYSDIAILYRTNAQSRTFEEEMRKPEVGLGANYRIYGGLSFYQRKEIKDIIAYFRLVANPDDEEAIKRIINYPARGIGATTVMKIADCAHQNQVSFWEVIGEPAHYGLNVNKGTLTKLDNFRLLISSFIERSHTTDVYELGDAIIKESGISQDIMSGRDADDLARQENLEEFLSGMSAFVEERREEGRMDEAFLTDYLQDVALLTDADSEGGKDEPRVSLMTVHAAKGLEFATVFIVGLEENIFPSPLAAMSVRELEEERRLLYVAITRAEKHCILTNAKNRFRYGKMEFDNPSRFIDEIDSSLIEAQDEMGGSYFGGGSSYDRSASCGERSSYGGGYGKRMPWDQKRRISDRDEDVPEWKRVTSQFRPDPKPASDTSSSSSSSRESLSSGNFKSVRALDAARRILGNNRSSSVSSTSSVSSSSAGSSFGALKEGCKIEHQRFGVGIVRKIEGQGENAKATVEFQNSGVKQLLLKYAKYTILN